MCFGVKCLIYVLYDGESEPVEAHPDYIRCVVVHPVSPYVLSSSDDMTIKLVGLG